jgi:hypothetical protein
VEILNQFLDNFRSVEFRRIPFDLFRKHSFHDQRTLNQFPIGRIIPIEDWMDEVASISGIHRPIYWIFHLAFGGSTFLSRYLGAFSNVVAFREPYPLTQLAMLYRHEQETKRQRVETILDATLKWYANQASVGSICSIKPHDIVNYFIPSAMELSRESSGLLLCTRLQTFVLKSLKEPIRREWIRSRLTSCGAEYNVAGKSRPLLSLTDAEAAAWVWFGFSLHIEKALRRFRSKLMLISCESLQASSNEILSQITNHLRLQVGLDELGQADSSFSGKHSKSSRAFDPESEAKELSTLAERYCGELALAEKLIDNLSQFAGVPQRFLQSYGNDLSEFEERMNVLS